jgi:hypothetical protein
VSLGETSKEWNTHDAKHCVSLATILDGLIDDCVFGRDLVGAGVAQVRHSGVIVAEVYLGEALIENDFGCMELEFESQLFVIAGNKRASALTSSRGTVGMGQKAPRDAGRVPVTGKARFSGIGHSHGLVPPQIPQRIFEVLEGKVEPFQ